MEEIAHLLRRYEKARLGFENSKEGDMPNLKADKEFKDIALSDLERAINEYIDMRVDFIITSKYPWIVK